MSILLPDESHCKSELGTLVYEGRKSNIFTGAVVDNREVTGLFNHVEYDVIVTAESTNKIVNDTRKFKAVTRYKDVSKIHAQLSTIHKQLYLKDKFPTFPAGMVWGSNAPEVTLERRKAIGIFLQFAVNNEVLCKTKVLQAFFDTFEEIVSVQLPSNPADFPPSEILTTTPTPKPVNMNRQASTISGPEELTEEEERPDVSTGVKEETGTMSETTTEQPEVIFHDLSADNEEQAPMQLESLCMNCHENGTTRLMCTRIPYYKQVIVMSFSCDHCGYRNSELQSGEAMQEFGTEIVLSVKEKADLNRQLVKSEYAAIEIPELELTIPNKSQPGEITTVEGILSRTRAGLEQDQPQRRIIDPDSATAIDAFLLRIDDLIELKTPFTLKLNDPTGNCYIQSIDPLHVDPRCITSHYYRRLADNKLIGIADDDAEEASEDVLADREWKSYEEAKQEVLRFHSPCPNCGVDCETCMKPTDIPYFQTVIIMATSCDSCGFKSNEVKAGGAIQDFGCRLSLKITDNFDLARDVLKSDTCSVSLPDLEIEVGYGALSGRFTTVEGLLQATKEQIEEQAKFFMGDSALSAGDGEGSEKSRTIQDVIDAIEDVLQLRRSTTLVLDDSAGNSYVQSLMAPLEDPKLEKVFYTRTFEQNDDLGLNDMKTENYEEMQPIMEEDEEEA